MIYIIIALVITIIFLFLIILNKKQFSFTINATLNNIDMFENTKSIALAMREVEPVGNSPVMDKYKKIINKAYNNIEKRADRGIIFDFEKVLLENYYLIFKSVSKEKLDLLANLPHKDKETRIVTLAKYVLEINDYEIKNNVLEIINNFTKFTPLSSEEIFLLPVAINYVLFLKLSELADISNNLQKVREFAIKDDKLKKSFINTDSYLYFYKKFNNLTQLDLDKLGVDVNLENVNYSFTTTLAKYEKMIKKCFDSIKSVKEHLTSTELKQHIWSHKIMSNNEVYANMDETSQIQYIKTVAKLSSFFRVSEKAIVDVVFNLAQRYNVHFGIILFENKVLIKLALSGKELKTRKLKDNELFQRVYVATIILLNIALAGVGSLMFKSLPLVICGFFALFVAFLKVSEGIVNVVASKIVPNRAMPKMNYKQMPKELETLVVVPCFIANENDCDNIINHIKVLEKTTNDINIKYALLVDFPQSKMQQTELDVKMQDLLISSLKHTNINCFIRKKVKNKNSFIPFERKRGAINDLNEYLICKNDYKFSAIAKEVETPKYVVLLDSDNVVSPNMICESINTISHPLNEKYDLLSYSSNYNLNSLKTRFSRRFLQCCGYESYNNYSNFYFNLTKYDIYCGKGIYNLQNYYRKLKDLIPNNRVLSHDILEGSILQTGAMNEKIYEDAPQNFASDVARQKRWQRGDIQLLPFLKSITNKSSFHNNAMKKPLIYNYLIFANAISILQPCILFAVICYFFVQKSLFLLVPIGIGLVLLPFLLFVQQISQVSNNIRAKAVFKKLYLQVINWFYNFLTLPFWAVSNIYLFFTTLFNTLFFKHNMLKWKTFSSFQQKNGFIKHFNLFLPTFVVFALLILLTKFNIGIAIYFVLEVIFAICLYFTGKPINNCLKINDNMAKELNKLAQKTYSYFENMNKDNELICDNYQQKPFVGKSVATSPTNLGFSVLSHVCAVKLQIIDIKTAVERIKKELFFIMRLKKYQGNLYNWYNIKTLQPLFPFFISSVDSGNFVACMFVVKAFLKENNCKEADIADKLIKGANLNFFLDETKQLYHIAYDTKNRKFEGYYDILASESRLLNYICAVFSKNLTVWNNLDRTCTPLLGNTLLSWSGTMFEYAMPQIFLQDFEGSLLTKSVKNACKIQYKNSCQGYFGISESGYYKFDEKLNYQYKAFGVGELAVRSEKNRCVISPYSAVLSLPYLKKKAYYNLVNMINNGFLGNFGFYEACDFTDGKNFVKSYMSHHQGMILATLTNVLHCNFIKDLFYKSELIQAGTPMLTELPIETRQSKLKKSEEFLYEPKREYEFVDSVQKLADFPKVFTLTNGEYSLLFDDYGNNYAFREVYFNNFRAEYEKNFGGFGYFIDKENDEVFSCAYSPIKSKINQFRVVNTQSSTTFINTAKNVKMSVCVPNFFAGDCRTFTIENTAKTAKTFEFVFYEQISLSTFEENSAHQAFNDMFVSSSFDKKLNAVIFTKASKEKEGDKHCAFVLCGLPNFKVETNQYNALGALKNEENLAFLKDYKIVEASVGDVIYPCCAFKASFEVPANSKKSFYLTQILESNLDTLNNLIEQANTPYFDEYAFQSSKISALSTNLFYLPTQELYTFATKLASKLLYEPYAKDKLHYMQNNRYLKICQKFNLIESNKILIFNYREGKNEELLVERLKVVKYLQLFNINTNVIVIYCKNDNIAKFNYYTKEFKFINAILQENYSKNDIDCLQNFAFFHLDSFKIETPKLAEGKRNTPNNPIFDDVKLDVPEIVFKTGEGGFDKDNNYIVNSILPTKMPYSNVICAKNGGFIATANGGGFSFFGNSRENKTTFWHNEPVKDEISEGIFLEENGYSWRINKGFGVNAYTKMERGNISYKNSKFGVISEVNEFMTPNGEAKVFETILNNASEIKRELRLNFWLEPVLNWVANRNFVYCEVFSDNLLKVTNVLTNKNLYIKKFNGAFVADKTNFIRRDSNNHNFAFNSEAFSNFNNSIVGVSCQISLQAEAFVKEYFVVCEDLNFIKNLMVADIELQKEISLKNFAQLNKIKIKTCDNSLNILFNDWLMYQTVSARINGRCGYYQVGGAFGFRDQLQDCLALLYSDCDYVKSHILYCAKRQLESGDVLHWWHPEFFGIKTKISDDKLFLPFLVCEYIEKTADESILEILLEYLQNEELDGREEIVKTWQPTNYAESLLKHCQKAIKSALVYGEHGLLKIGAGDWNDALNKIGNNNRGESVWLSMFAKIVMQKFLPYLSETEQKEYKFDIDKLSLAIELCFDHDRYKRAFTDDGEWLGSANSEVCKLDLLPQSFAILADCDVGNSKIALETAQQLVDRRNGVVKLIDTPYDKQHYCGYISAYPKGVRENGGQYTHAVVWYIKALCKAGFSATAYDILKMINPINKCANSEQNKKYKLEPYALSADVYSGEGNVGKGGWSWYTGSSSWLYYVILEDILGFKKVGNGYKIANTKIFDTFTIEVCESEKQILFEFLKGEKTGVLVKNTLYKFDEVFVVPYDCTYVKVLLPY